jgi:hypothetical protein
MKDIKHTFNNIEYIVEVLRWARKRGMEAEHDSNDDNPMYWTVIVFSITYLLEELDNELDRIKAALKNDLCKEKP